MEYKKENKKILLISLLVLLLGIGLGVLSTPLNDFGLYWADAEAIIETLVLFPLAIFLISLILLFSHSELIVFSWIRFAKYYLPVAAFLVIITSSDRGGWISIGPDRESMIWFTSTLFFLISLIIIAVKSWKLRKG